VMLCRLFFVGCRVLVVLRRLHLARQARRAGAGCGASDGRPGHRPGSPAVLGLQAPPPNSLRALWALRSDNGGEHVDEARCARGPETLRSSAPLRRATTHPHPPSLPSCFTTANRGLSSYSPPDAFARAPAALHWSSRQRGAAGGDFGGGEKRSGRVGARSAHPKRTRRRCLSAAHAVREASSAARPGHEHRSGVGHKADRTRMSPWRPSADASGAKQAA
jgi:hypothetical protein